MVGFEDWRFIKSMSLRAIAWQSLRTLGEQALATRLLCRYAPRNDMMGA
jgi:hypothetical protein